MKINFSIEEINFDLLKMLLIDRTTKKNIIWATNDYNALGEEYSARSEIKIELITGNNSKIIQPRFLKSDQHKKNRVRDKAEIFTPAWICNEQNNLIDQSLNTSDWRSYVEANFLEITCGEAPYIVSRYDSVTGEKIPIKNRIGLLDRKLRLVDENISSHNEWIEWTKKAFQSVYGYEFQGDNLLIARMNLMLTYIEYYKNRFSISPEQDHLKEIAIIISWNLWQMDGLKNIIPFAKEGNLELFDETSEENIYCKIFDWKDNKENVFDKDIRR